MTKEQLAKIRAIVYDAYCEGDTEAEGMLAVIDAALAAEPQPFDDNRGKVVWKVTCSDGSTCHFGVQSMAIAYARGGKVEEIKLRDFQVVGGNDSAPVAAPQREWVESGAMEPAEQQERSRKALAEPDQWQPFLKEGETPFERFIRDRADMDALLELYKKAIAAPQREWQGFSYEEVEELQSGMTATHREVRAIESALRAKNEVKP